MAENPLAMILHCPSCSARHIDEGEFETKPHHTHACQKCGMVWRPAIGPTVGVQFLPGFKNVTQPVVDGRCAPCGQRLVCPECSHVPHLVACQQSTGDATGDYGPCGCTPVIAPSPARIVELLGNERAAYVSAERSVGVLAGRLTELEADIRRRDVVTRQWSLALQSLTPGGSEFVDDPKRCAEFVRAARDAQHASIVQLKKRSDERAAVLREIANALGKLLCCAPEADHHAGRCNCRQLARLRTVAIAHADPSIDPKERRSRLDIEAVIARCHLQLEGTITTQELRRVAQEIAIDGGE